VGPSPSVPQLRKENNVSCLKWARLHTCIPTLQHLICIVYDLWPAVTSSFVSRKSFFLSKSRRWANPFCLFVLLVSSVLKRNLLTRLWS
jgi:hypothetical protein